MTASNLGRVSVEASQPKQAGSKCVPKCLPMSHQNSGDHGHEMYPQQFVRLVGCHETPPTRAKEETKLH
ncbi:hypothetical protein C2U70_10935 [Bradyrhizobium guangdongense]|uniref:hypothetical protein n=1 Tax=Bradyrhizobium guangdongense TaxID=1325090 RepID=UPI00112B3769|nr:hypothetical protein [Bradyrhizobium guangdongense]TPQ37456.1 hypothetical protein C2U70_10935 [Bradyrhizobium guangdongense]